MPNPRIRWRAAAFREIRTSQKAAELVEKVARNIADAAGDGYEVRGPQITAGRGRARASVITATAEAAVDNARHNTLIRSLDAGRQGL